MNFHTLNFPTIRFSSSILSSDFFPLYSSNVSSHSENPSNSGWLSNSFGNILLRDLWIYHMYCNWTFRRATLSFIFFGFLSTFGLNLVPNDLAAFFTVIIGFLLIFWFWNSFLMASVFSKLSPLFAFPSFAQKVIYFHVGVKFYLYHFFKRCKVFCPPVSWVLIFIGIGC